MIEQKALEKIYLKLTNREDFINLMKGEQLKVNDDNLKISLWHKLEDMNNEENKEYVEKLLENRKLYLVATKTKGFCSTYTLEKEFYKIGKNENSKKYSVYRLNGKRIKYNKSIYVNPLAVSKRTENDILELYVRKNIFEIFKSILKHINAYA